MSIDFYSCQDRSSDDSLDHGLSCSGIEGAHGGVRVIRTATAEPSAQMRNYQMGWSTQELADLAGTTLRTVRHYHDVGLLPPPPRRTNGYKSYGVSHLTIVLRIRRLVELGASLSEIRTLDLTETPHHGSDEYIQKLRDLDKEAEATINRLQAMRARISEELDADSHKDAKAPQALGATDEDFMTVASRILSDESMSAWNALRDLASDHQALIEFSQLTADADPDELTDLPERLAEAVRELHTEIPELAAPTYTSGRARRFGPQALHVAIAELYHPTQLEILRRTGNILSGDGKAHGD